MWLEVDQAEVGQDEIPSVVLKFRIDAAYLAQLMTLESRAQTHEMGNFLMKIRLVKRNLWRKVRKWGMGIASARMYICRRLSQMYGASIVNRGETGTQSLHSQFLSNESLVSDLMTA